VKVSICDESLELLVAGQFYSKIDTGIKQKG
jgi:hypothetical protein